MRFILAIFVLTSFAATSYASDKRKHLVIVSICSLRHQLLPSYGGSKDDFSNKGGFHFMANNAVSVDGLYSSYPYINFLKTMTHLNIDKKVFSFNDYVFLNIGLSIDRFFRSAAPFESRYLIKDGINQIEDSLSNHLGKIERILEQSNLYKGKRVALLLHLREMHYPQLLDPKAKLPKSTIKEQELPYFIYKYPLQALRRKKIESTTKQKPVPFRLNYSEAYNIHYIEKTCS